VKHLSNTFKITLLIFVSFYLSGCLPQPTTERAAVVIFNDTTSVIQYQLALSKKLTPLSEVQGKAFDYVYEYEQTGKIDVLTKELSQLILIIGGCKVVLSRAELEYNFVIDPEGRNTWNLHVTQKLTKQADCHS
jgi:hypothetical protein